MRKTDDVVLKETIYISLWVIMLSVLMQLAFFIIKKWDYTVLTGNLLSGVAVVLNFLFMGIGIQKAVEKEAKDAKATLQLSKTYRMLFLIIVLVIGVASPCFNIWAVVIPVIFPRIAIAFRPLFNRR